MGCKPSELSRLGARCQGREGWHSTSGGSCTCAQHTHRCRATARPRKDPEALEKSPAGPFEDAWTGSRPRSPCPDHRPAAFHNVTQHLSHGPWYHCAKSLGITESKHPAAHSEARTHKLQILSLMLCHHATMTMTGDVAHYYMFTLTKAWHNVS